MNAIEFTTELTDSSVLNTLRNKVTQLPISSSVHVFVLTDDSDDKEWHLGAYEQFLREYSDDDDIYTHGLNNMI
ncbi:MAG: hypothetical protein ACOYMG_04460 [Candidatus Methylumidiphilus sp.]